MISLHVQFLTGRYVATAYNDRSRGEWPPHPARVFSALAAAWFAEEEERSPVERDALEWLEGQPPPQIEASGASHRSVKTSFVPVNDTSVVLSASLENARSKLAEAEQDLRAAAEARGAAVDPSTRQRKALDKAVAKAEKSLDKARTALTRRAGASVAPVARPSAKALKDATQLLPDHRGRQPRTFPSVTPEVPEVVFHWPAAEPGPERLGVLDALAARVTRIGHSSSLVSCVFRVGEVVEPTLIPSDDGGQVLRVVTAGQMRRLEVEHELSQGIHPRQIPCAFLRYGAPGPARHEPHPAPLFSREWIVFRRSAGPRLPLTRVEDVARALRGAILSHAPEPIAEGLSGHTPARRPSESPHLAFVPLPWVGRKHADGTLMGVALVPPTGMEPEALDQLYAALGSWERSGAVLNLGRAGRLDLERVSGQQRLTSLRAGWWCRPSDRWVSVTPVALDHNPGNLLSGDPAVAEAAFLQAEETIATSVERLGLPRPAWVEARFRAGTHGARSARKHPSFPADRRKTRRVLVHATLGFEHPVRGPLLLGAGRYLGLGLFLPTGGSDALR